ncbi:MAG: hypothetical protein ACRC2V_18855 [Xenococcaceae cyanobacterium]
MNQLTLDNFESNIKSVLDFDYTVRVNSRSTYLATCDDVLIPLNDDDSKGKAKKQIAWGFDLLQEDYEVNVVMSSSDNSSRSVWKGKGMSAKEAYANLAKLP